MLRPAFRPWLPPSPAVLRLPFGRLPPSPAVLRLPLAVFRLAGRCFAWLWPSSAQPGVASPAFRPSSAQPGVASPAFGRLPPNRALLRLPLAVFRPTGQCFACLSAKVSEAERFAGASPHTPSLTCDAAGAGGRRKKRAPYHLLCGRVCSSAGRQGVSVKNHKGEKPRLYDSLQTSSPCLGRSY